MLGFLRSAFLPFSPSSPIASSSRSRLPSLPTLSAPMTQVRYRGNLGPRKTKHKKAMKGMPIRVGYLPHLQSPRFPLPVAVRPVAHLHATFTPSKTYIAGWPSHLSDYVQASVKLTLPQPPTGGSIKGTTLARGEYGLRLLASCRLSADQLFACQETLKRKLKVIKGCEIYMRVYPHIPVCVKGNETRMGKGKGTFEFWACRVPVGRVVFEVGGGGVREEIAKSALKLVQAKLPVRSEFINTSTAPRLGSLVSADLGAPLSTNEAVPAVLGSMAEKRDGRAVNALVIRDEDKAEEISRAVGNLSIGGAGVTKPEVRV